MILINSTIILKCHIKLDTFFRFFQKKPLHITTAPAIVLSLRTFLYF
jgi:hypothetical protein